MGSRPVLGHVSFATGSFCRSCHVPRCHIPHPPGAHRALGHFERSQERHRARVPRRAASFAEESQRCVTESPCFTYVQAAFSPPAQVQLRAEYESPEGSMRHGKEHRGGARTKTMRENTSPWETWPWCAGSALASGSQHPLGTTTSCARAS